MAHDAPQATGPTKLVIRNIGLLAAGALERPILDADTIVAENGKISALGRFKDVDTERVGIVPLTEYNPDGSVKTGPEAGLGYIPSFKECPANTR